MGRAAPGSLFGLAPNGVYRAPSIALRAVGSYPTFSPLPGKPGGLFSVALAVDYTLKCSLPRASLSRGEGYAASRPAEFGLSSPGKPEATLRPPGSENQAKLPVCPRPNKPLGQAGLTLAKRSLKGARRLRRITTIPNNHGNRSRNQGPGFHPEIEE